MIYIHIETTDTKLNKYCIPINKTTRTTSSLNLKLPEKLNLRETLEYIKKESTYKSKQYLLDYQILDNLKINYNNLHKSLPKQVQLTYNLHYFQHPKIYLEFNENTNKTYTDINFILTNDVPNNIILNNKNILKKIKHYLQNFLPSTYYIEKNPCNFYIRDYKGYIKKELN